MSVITYFVASHKKNIEKYKKQLLNKYWKKIKKYINEKNISERSGNCQILVEIDQNIQN